MGLSKLENSGLPIYLDDENNIMALSAVLKLGGFGRKETEKMSGLLADETDLPMEEAFYDVYRAIAYPEDEELFRNYDFQYDITIVMPGQINGECKKTAGHYHGYNPERTNTYGEVYEVIKGTALYILQKSPDFDKDPGCVTLEDVILTTVHEGETLIVPPNYGHASVNIGSGPLVFSNLAYKPCPVLYDSVRCYHGMAYYIKKENGTVRAEFNHNYKEVRMPEVRFATVKERPKLGIRFGVPVYESFKQNPEAFDFLGHPDNYIKEIMDALVYHDTLQV